MRADTDKISNKRPLLMLDPKTDLKQKTTTRGSKATKFVVSELKQTNPTNPAPQQSSSRILRFFFAFLLGACIVLAFHKAASLGYFNGVTDNAPLKQRFTLPRWFQKQEEPTAEKSGFCSFENENLAAGCNMILSASKVVL